MGLSADVQIVPGLHDLVSQGPRSDAHYEEAARAFLETPGVSGTRLEEALNDVLKGAAEDTGEWPGWVAALGRWMAGEVHDVEGEEGHDVLLDAYLVTVPHVNGAKASLVVSTSKSAESTISFTIVGVGGGTGFVVTLKESLTREVTSAQRVALSAPGVFQRIVVRRSGEPIGAYARLAALDTRNLTWHFGPAPELDSDALGGVISSRAFDQRGADGMTTYELGFEQGSQWSMSAGFSLAKLGLETKISAKLSYLRSVEVSYVLPGRHLYVARRHEVLPVYTWSIDDP